MRLLVRSVALIATVAFAAPLSAASIHPRLVKATPAADSRSAEPPRTLTLTFNESIDLAMTRVTLHRGETTIRLDALRVAAGDDSTVAATIPGNLGMGRYTVRWQVTGDDGHPVRGTFNFDVVAANPAKSTPPQR